MLPVLLVESIGKVGNRCHDTHLEQGREPSSVSLLLRLALRFLGVCVVLLATASRKVETAVVAQLGFKVTNLVVLAQEFPLGVMQVNHVEQGHHDESDCGKSKQDVEIVWGHLLFSL